METFYDGDLKDIWDSDLDPTDSLKMSTDTDIHDWFLERDVKDPAVILNDKLISDALLNGTLPIKSEHSYSLNSDGDSLPESPRSLHTKIDDMEDECYPAISLKTATSNLRLSDATTASIDPKCLTISTSMPIHNSPVMHTNSPLLSSTAANSLVTTTASTSAHNGKLVLPLAGSHSSIYEGFNKLLSAPITLNPPSLENANHLLSTTCGGANTTITIAKADPAKQQQQLYLPQQLPNRAKLHCDSSSSSRESSSSPDICSDIEIDESCIKDEPMSRDSSCPPSPDSQRGPVAAGNNPSLTLGLANMAAFKNSDLVFEHKNGCLQLTPASQSLLKSQQFIVGSNTHSQNIIIPKFNIKTEPPNASKKYTNGTTPTKSNGGSAYGLPLTPPSSLQSDDSEGNLTPEHLLAPLSPNTTVSISVATTAAGGPLIVPAIATAVQQRRNASAMSPNSLSAAGRHANGGSTRQPIHTPLISTQPKGSTGNLILTEEEKRTLLAEGYPIPQKLPLTKAEEKSLKKIRRKIKNKISAQESRRKKKEYMDQLERRVEILVNENSDYRKRVDSLEDSNANLLSQLHKLQALVQRQNLKRS